MNGNQRGEGRGRGNGNVRRRQQWVIVRREGRKRAGGVSDVMHKPGKDGSTPRPEGHPRVRRRFVQGESLERRLDAGGGGKKEREGGSPNYHATWLIFEIQNGDVAGNNVRLSRSFRYLAIAVTLMLLYSREGPRRP